MKIISIFNNKGGTGKTTTSLNLASYLSDQLDYRVLLVDLDAQANLSSVVGANSNISIQIASMHLSHTDEDAFKYDKIDVEISERGLEEIEPLDISKFKSLPRKN